MKIFAGNFSYDASEDDLRGVFGAYGNVETVKIIRDKFTGESKGFGFIEMPNKKEAQSAIESVEEIEGRRVTVNEARPQVRRDSGGGRGGPNRGKKFDRRRREY